MKLGPGHLKLSQAVVHSLSKVCCYLWQKTLSLLLSTGSFQESLW